MLMACKSRPEVFTPELYSWEVARDSIVLPQTGWVISCGSPDKAIYRYGPERLSPGVACDRGWLFDAFLLSEVPCEGEDLPDYWLNPVYGTVASLEKAIADAVPALGEPPVKRMYTIALPHCADDDECFAYIDRVRSMADSLDCPHLELLGFTVTGEVSQRVLNYAAAFHEAVLDLKPDVSFDYSVVEDIMDQPGVKSRDGLYTLKDVPARQKALIDALSSRPNVDSLSSRPGDDSLSSGPGDSPLSSGPRPFGPRGEIPCVIDCGDNTLVQLSRSPYASDKALLEIIYDYLLTK